MLIRKQSNLTGEWHELELPVTQQQINKWVEGELIQHAMPHLTPAQRQFIISGITEAEWEKAFGDEDNIDPNDLLKVAMTAGRTVIVVKPDGTAEVKK